MPLGATLHQLGAAVMLVAFFAPRLFDYSQCTRACRVHYGEDSNWFKPASITGTRKLAAPSTCSCSDGGTGIGDAPRYLEPVPTSEQEPYWGGRVCAIVQGGGDDGGDDGGGGSGGGGDGDGGKGGEWHSSALHTWILSEPQPVPAHFVFELSMYFFGGSAHPCASHSAFASSNVASKGLMVVFGLTAELQIDLHSPMSG